MKIKKENQKNNNINFNYKNLYSDLLKKIKIEVDKINASDYSKRSLGKFKENIERIVHNFLNIK